jgi:predicted DNA-binding protein (MmcQ/YjbR family)
MARTAKPKPRAAVKARPKPRAARPRLADRVSTHPPKLRTAETLALIERLRQICLALPGVTEKLAWAEPTWRIGKIFAMCDTYHHGSPHLSVHLAAPPGAQAALIDADPARFFRPPYTGGAGWIGVVLDTDPDWDMVASLVATAYEVIAQPPRARARR